MKLSDDPNILLEQISLKNQLALKKLYDLLSPKLFAVSLRITKQERLSEEVLQDSFLKVWEKASMFDVQKAQAITWVGTIVRNKSIDVIRQNNKHEYHDELDDNVVESLHDSNDNPEQLAMLQSELGPVKICMDRLDARYKQVILLAYLEGYSHQQIADSQSIPLGSIKTWIHRGVLQVRDCLKGEGK